MNKPSASSRFNFANLLTFARIVAIPLILLYLWIDSETSRTIALVIYVFLCATDFLDGYLARLFKYNSILGEILDPIADKLLIVAVLVMLVMVDRVGGVHNIAVLLILMREILISGLREYMALGGIKLPVIASAKWKTALQMTALGFLIAGPNGDAIFSGASWIGIGGLWLAAIWTVYTGYLYFAKAQIQINNTEKNG